MKTRPNGSVVSVEQLRCPRWLQEFEPEAEPVEAAVAAAAANTRWREKEDRKKQEEAEAEEREADVEVVHSAPYSSGTDEPAAQKG